MPEDKDFYKSFKEFVNPEPEKLPRFRLDGITPVQKKGIAVAYNNYLGKMEIDSAEGRMSAREIDIIRGVGEHIQEPPKLANPDDWVWSLTAPDIDVLTESLRRAQAGAVASVDPLSRGDIETLIEKLNESFIRAGGEEREGYKKWAQSLKQS